MRVVGIQMEPKLGDVDHNRDRILHGIKNAKALSGDLVVFPEAVVSGYGFDSLDAAVAVSEPIPGPTVQMLELACRRHEIHVVVGMLERAGDEIFNCAVLIGPDGLIGKYRKVHLPFLGVDRFISLGDGPFKVYETAVGRIGLLICYDSFFPEAARTLALKKAQLIAMPTNWPGDDPKGPLFVVCRAYENRIYFAGINRIGSEGGSHFNGQSRIANTRGRTLAEAGSGPEVLVADLDLSLADEKRRITVPGKNEADFIRDRRPEMYELGPYPE